MSRPFLLTLIAALAAFAAVSVWQRSAMTLPADNRAEATANRPAKALQVPANARVATFAGGCFWGVEEAFRTQAGVLDTQAGYTGGATPNPTYKTVHQKGSGYTEVVEVIYDPVKVSYRRLLETFFAQHDPTTRFPTGSAYGSVVFFHDRAQETAARAMIRALSASRRFDEPLATEVKAAPPFWPAEERHQHYYASRAEAARCSAGGL